MTSTLPTSYTTTAVDTGNIKFNDIITTLPINVGHTLRPSVVPIDIGATLSQRGSRYGPFTGHARITQDLKHIMHTTHGWAKLTSDQKESLEMIVHKIGRILNGDPNYDDSWVDIAGYAKLVGDRLTTGKET